MWALLAQASQTTSDWLSSLGPFLPFGVLAVGIILDQRATIKEVRGQLASVNERLVESAVSTTEALNKTAAALHELTKEYKGRER